jgi:hypothetical protein
MTVVNRWAASLRHLSLHPFFQRTDLALSSCGIVWWWEKRRLIFNLVVGATGIVTSIVFLIGGLISESRLGEPIGLPDPPIAALFGAVIYGILANILYTGGWFTELLVRHVWGEPSRDFSRIALTLGVLFSVAVTLIPAGLEVIAVSMALAMHSGNGG